MRWGESWNRKWNFPRIGPYNDMHPSFHSFILRCGEQTKTWLWTSSGPQPGTQEAQFVSVDHPFHDCMTQHENKSVISCIF